MTITVNSSQQFDIICSEKSIQLIDQSIKQNKIPSGASHILTSIKTIVAEPFSIAGRILNIAGNILMIVLLPVAKGEKQKKELFLYRLCRLVCLDPLDILVGIASSIIRIASSILGIGSPLLAAKGWKMSEQLELWNLNQKAKLWNKIAPDASPYKVESKKIVPETAVSYLGEKLSAKLEKSTKNATTLAELKEAIKRDFVTFLIDLDTADTALFTSAFSYDESTTSSVYLPILKKIAPKDGNQTHAQIIENTKELKIKEIHRLQIHIESLYWLGNSGKAGDSLMNVVKNISDQKKSPLLVSESLKQKFTDYLQFGNVVCPTY